MKKRYKITGYTDLFLFEDGMYRSFIDIHTKEYRYFSVVQKTTTEFEENYVDKINHLNITLIDLAKIKSCNHCYTKSVVSKNRQNQKIYYNACTKCGKVECKDERSYKEKTIEMLQIKKVQAVLKLEEINECIEQGIENTSEYTQMKYLYEESIRLTTKELEELKSGI